MSVNGRPKPPPRGLTVDQRVMLDGLRHDVRELERRMNGCEATAHHAKSTGEMHEHWRGEIYEMLATISNAVLTLERQVRALREASDDRR